VDLPDSLGLKLAVPEMPASLESPVVIAESPIPSRHRHRRVFVTALVLVVVLAVVFGFDLGGVRHRLVGEPSVPRIQSIAVLPLENLSKDPEQEYFADGMTDELITNLAQISGIEGDLTNIGDAVQGNEEVFVRDRSGAARLMQWSKVPSCALATGVRISAQLIEASTDHSSLGGQL